MVLECLVTGPVSLCTKNNLLGGLQPILALLCRLWLQVFPNCWQANCALAVLQNAIPVWVALLTTLTCIEKFRYGKVGTGWLTQPKGVPSR